MKNSLLGMIIFLVSLNFAVSGPLEIFNQSDTVRGTVPVIVDGDVQGDPELIAYAQFQNTTDSKVDFKISMEFLEIAPTHSGALCWEMCYAYTDSKFTAPTIYSLAAHDASAISQFTGHLQPFKFISGHETEAAAGKTITRYSFMPVGGSEEDVLHYDVVFIYTNATDVSEDALNFSVTNIFPNPANNILSVDFGSGFSENITATVFDLNGQTMAVKNIEAGITAETFDISNFAPGTYYLNIRKGHNIRTKKFNVVK